MSAADIIERLFALSHALHDKATTLMHDADRTRDEFVAAAVLEFIAIEIETAFAEVIECEGTA